MRRGEAVDAGIQRIRIDVGTVMPAAVDAMSEVERAVAASGLDQSLLELVRARASQLNGCAHCLDMHTQDARALGGDERRLHLLAAWRTAPVFTPAERAALAWCESLTLLPERGAPDDIYQTLTHHFTPAECVALTLAVVAINGWNRLAVGLGAQVDEDGARRRPGDPAARTRPRRRTP